MSTAVIDWGDGTAPENVPIVGTPASWTISGKQHVYAAAGAKTVRLTGPNLGTTTQGVTIPPAPAPQGAPTTGTTGAATATTLVIPKPASLTNGETLVAAIRGQVAIATDYTCDGWRRISASYAGVDVTNCRYTAHLHQAGGRRRRRALPPTPSPGPRGAGRTNGVIFRVADAGPTQPAGKDLDANAGGIGAYGCRHPPAQRVLRRRHRSRR